MHVEHMAALAPDCAGQLLSRQRIHKLNQHTQWAVVARHLARGTAALVGHTTDTAYVSFGVRVVRLGASVPSPLGYSVPVLDLDLHSRQ